MAKLRRKNDWSNGESASTERGADGYPSAPWNPKGQRVTRPEFGQSDEPRSEEQQSGEAWKSNDYAEYDENKGRVYRPEFEDAYSPMSAKANENGGYRKDGDYAGVRNMPRMTYQPQEPDVVRKESANGEAKGEKRVGYVPSTYESVGVGGLNAEAKPSTASSGTAEQDSDALKGGNLSDASDSEWMKQVFRSAPGAVSQEEEDRRIRGARSAELVGNLGKLGQALANMYYVGEKGAPSQTVSTSQSPNYSAYRDKWQAQRDAREAYVMKGRQYLDALREKEQARKNAEALKRYQIDANNEYRNNMLAYQMNKQADANQLAQDKFDYQQAYNEKRLQEQHRHNIAMENKPTSGGRGSKSTKQFSGGGRMYSIPSNVDQARMEKEIVKDAIERGVIDPNNYVTDPRTGQPVKGSNGNPVVNPSKPRKTDAEMIKEAQKKWDDGMEAVVGRYGGSTGAQSKTMASTQTQGGSAGSTATKGSTGSWGSSINRKKK